MNPEYKILRMKDLAQKLELKEAKSFKRSEEYLEYAIKEINSKSKFYWYQYLFLIDVLYVVIVAKSSVVSAYESHPARSASGMAARSTSGLTTKNKRVKEQADKNAEMPAEELVEAPEIGSKVHRTKLSWNH